MLDTKLLFRTAAGALGGALATAVMSGVMALGAKSHLLGEPPPRKLVRRTMQRLGAHPSRQTQNVTAWLSHFAFGMGMGALYALFPRQEQRAHYKQSAARGALFGMGVWTTSYVGWAPALGLMPRPSEDRPGRPTTMIVAHLVYGAVLGAAYSAMGAAIRSRPVKHPA